MLNTNGLKPHSKYLALISLRYYRTYRTALVIRYCASDKIVWVISSATFKKRAAASYAF